MTALATIPFFLFFFLLAYLDGAQWGVEGRVSEMKVMSVGGRGGHRLGWWESFEGRTRNKLHTLIEWHAGRSLATNPFTRARLVVSETTKGELARSGERRTQRKKNTTTGTIEERKNDTEPHIEQRR